MPPIHQDGAFEDTGDNGVDAEDAFSSLWGLDADKPSKDAADEKEEEDERGKPADDNEDTDDTAEDGDEASEETPEDDEDGEGDEDESEGDGDKNTVEIKDDHKFKVTVDGEEREFSLGSLKRLAGQEASLTRKSQEVATQRKNADNQAAAQLALMSRLVERAKARYEPYSKIDLLVAAKDANVSAEELTAVRDAKQAAYDELLAVTGDMQSFTQALQHQQHLDLKDQAREAIKTLSDPEKGIEGWSESLYGEIRTFAIDTGMSPEIVNNLVDPAAIKLINMARLYAKGKAKVQSDKSDKKKAPKRIVKSSATAEAIKTVTKTAKAAEPMKRLQKSGSTDDAADAFMARWSRGDED